MNKTGIIPVFIPHLGCPHDCVFCNQKKITNSDDKINFERVREEIEKYLYYFRRKKFVEIAFYGGSFTAIDINFQKELLSLALDYKAGGHIDQIRLSTRPDAINPDILDNLREFQVNTIELGVQSLDDLVLNASARGHSSKEVYKSVDLIKRYNFKLGLQMMIGLPKDSLEKSIMTAKKITDLRADFVRIYPTLVIKDTYLDYLYRQGKYRPLSLDEAIHWATPIVILFKLSNIDIIRAGLQVTDNIQLGKDVISGPFHPAFRQMVEANIYKEILDLYFQELKIENQEVEIYIDDKEISNLAGQKSSNIHFLKKKYMLKKFTIRAREEEGILIRIDKDTYKIDSRYYMKKILEELYQI